MKPFGLFWVHVLWTIFLVVGVKRVLGHALNSASVDKRDGNTTAAPLVASISQYFEGNDGAWSSFAIQVGRQAQNLRVFPSTASTATWVVEEAGCPADAPSDCSDTRGGIFNPNNSLTWVPNSIYSLGLEESLGFSEVNGDFGFDTVTLGWQGDGGPSVEHSIVAGIGDTTLTWLGVLGLSPLPTNFSTFNSPQPSFLQLLRTQDRIPSLSWAYTAGASYRFDRIFGSLIFGGYDTSRFSGNDVTFPFYEDVERNFQVALHRISTDTSSDPLLSTSVFALIDSTVPYIYLPEEACTAFEEAFGLTWNSTSELYLINDTIHNDLRTSNPNVTFTIGPQESGGATVDIVFPYGAFDLNISWPYVPSSSRYFPLKRAANTTQYTLGRTFLQEAYLIADFERGNFSVFPCKWEENALSTLVAIRSVNDTLAPTTPTPSGSPSSKSALSAGAIAGIAIGAAALLSLLALLVWLRRTKRLIFALHRKKSFELDGSAPLPHDPPHTSAASAEPKKMDPGQELDSHSMHELHAQHKFGLLEAPAGMENRADVAELADGEQGTVFEMEGSAVAGERKTAGGGERGEGVLAVPQITLEVPTPVRPEIVRQGTSGSVTRWEEVRDEKRADGS